MANEILNFDKIKQSIIEYLKSTFSEYSQLSFDKSTSQDLIADIQSYVTQLMSQRFEQSISDFYIETQQSDKINLLLSQYGYRKSFGIPSQTQLKLTLDENSMYEFNELDLASFTIPQLSLLVSDDNNHLWTNKNSILVTKTPQTFTKRVKISGQDVTRTYNKYSLVSITGSDEIPFVQMNYYETAIVDGLNVPNKIIEFLSETRGFPVNNYFIRDQSNIDLKILPFQRRQELSGIYYDLYDEIDIIDQSKYNIEDYDSFINNKYLIMDYNDILRKFIIINGDDQTRGFMLKTLPENKTLTLQFYITQGSRGQQEFGQVNKFAGTQQKILLDNRIYLSRPDFTENNDNIRVDLFSDIVYLNRNLKTGELIPDPPSSNQRVSLYDFFDIQNQSTPMQSYGWKKVNIVVQQQTPVIQGKDVEKLEDIKYNFSKYIKQKDKLVTVTDIEQYLEMFLKGLTLSLNQTQVYKEQIINTIVNSIQNTVFILPQVMKDENYRNLSFPIGTKIYGSDLPEDPQILPKFQYTYEKDSIIEEVKSNILQTMNVEFQNSEMLEIITNLPISVWQDTTIPVNSIISGIKQKIDNFLNFYLDFFDPFESIDLLNLYINLTKVNGIISIDMERYKDQFILKSRKELESKFVLPMQIQTIDQIRDTLKTQYMIPFTYHQTDEEIRLNDIQISLFGGQIGRVVYLEEELDDSPLISQPVSQLPIDIVLKDSRMDEILENIPTIQSDDYQTKYIIDQSYSKQEKQTGRTVSGTIQLIVLTVEGLVTETNLRVNEQINSEFVTTVINSIV